jgi:hypothetical protein
VLHDQNLASSSRAMRCATMLVLLGSVVSSLVDLLMVLDWAALVVTDDDQASPAFAAGRTSCLCGGHSLGLITYQILGWAS